MGIGSAVFQGQNQNGNESDLGAVPHLSYILSTCTRVFLKTKLFLCILACCTHINRALGHSKLSFWKTPCHCLLCLMYRSVWLWSLGGTPPVSRPRLYTATGSRSRKAQGYTANPLTGPCCRDRSWCDCQLGQTVLSAPQLPHIAWAGTSPLKGICADVSNIPWNTDHWVEHVPALVCACICLFMWKDLF